MADYRPDTCAYCGAETWCEIRRGNGKPQCRACKVERFFSEVLYKPLGFTLLPWQRDQVLRPIYGTVDPATGRRQYGAAHIEVAKKNGKSFLVGGLPIYHLLMEREQERRALEAYGAASAKDQAGIVFRAAAELVRDNPVLRDRLRIIESTKRIVRRDGAGFYAVISADGDVQDGIEPSLAIIDELHRWKTAKAHTLYNVLTKGTISRDEPLVPKITTAGEEHESPLWWEEHEIATQILNGSIVSKRLYVAIWAADEKRLKDDPEYWKSREARVAANPSHEDLGGFLKDERIVEELDKAIASPAKKRDYLRYHLNVPLSDSEGSVIEMPQWIASGGDVNLRSWPVYDADLLYRKWGLKNRTCYAGVDCSWTTDLTALSLVFPPEGDDHLWHVMVFFFIPRDRIDELERRCKVPLRDWVDREFIRATPGNAVDTSAIKDRLEWAREAFDLREVGFDPWNYREPASRLAEDGYECLEVRQGYASLSEATKKLLEMYPDAVLIHGNNPVLNWNAGCLSVQGDRKDNIQPAKPERAKSSKRIDGMSATVTALVPALQAETTAEVGVRAIG